MSSTQTVTAPPHEDIILTSLPQKPTPLDTGDLESQPSTPAPSSPTAPANATSIHTSALERNVKWKIFALNVALFLAGINDASTGALIPYLKLRYDIGLAFVALVYVITFLGWLAAALTNVHVTARLGMSGALTLGATCQALAYVVMSTHPPYGVYVSSFFLAGLGVAYQDAQANTFCANLPRAHLYLGILHGTYGLGALVAPLIATAIATSNASYDRWYYFYFVALGLAVVNLAVVTFSFRLELVEQFKHRFRKNVEGETRQEERAAKNEKANEDFRAIIRRKDVWIICAFFFTYVGAEVTAGGWVVEFLIEVRGGNPHHVGYIASAFWGGLTLGRVLLAEPTNRLGERLSIFILLVCALTVQFIFWFVPSIAVSGVMIGLLGFFLGPFFPVGISLATKLLPRELHGGSIGFMSTTGSAGSAAFPFLTGAIASRKGVKVLQPILVALLAAMGICWALIPKIRRPRQ